MFTTYKKTDPARGASILIEPEELLGVISDDAVRIVDFSQDSREYDHGHIPGAAYLPIDAVFADDSGRHRAFRPPGEVAAALGAIGIAPDDDIIVYDSAALMWAGRLFLALGAMGFGKVRVLNGGMRGWLESGFPTSREVRPAAVRPFTPIMDLHDIVDADWIGSRLGSPELHLVDARTRNEYLGVDVRAARGGHIPGAHHLEWSHNLKDGHSLKHRSLLERQYRDLLLSSDSHAAAEESIASFRGTVVTYCQSGVRAANSYFVLKYVGFRDVRIFMDSWQVWGNRSDLPIEIGP